MMIAIDLWVTVHGITSLLIAKPEFPWPDTHELIEHIIDTQLRGLRRDGEGGAGAVGRSRRVGRWTPATLARRGDRRPASVHSPQTGAAGVSGR